MEQLLIRKANETDATTIANYLFLAMEEILYEFIQERNEQKGKNLLIHFAKQTNNQYSFENCWIAEYNNEIIGCACLYEGEKLQELRQPIIDFVRTHYHKAFNPEPETQAGEIYLDCISINPKMQGKSFGSKLLSFLIIEYVHQQQQTLGLLVDEDNPNAKKLYLKMGFEPIGLKSLMGKKLEHLQYKP